MYVKEVDSSTIDWDESVEFLIIGGGGCGLTAAASAGELGVDTLLLEKASEVGGKAKVTTGQICSIGTDYQREEGIDDSPEAFYEDLRACQEEDPEQTLDRDLITTVAATSGGTIDWMHDTVGVDFHLHTGQFAMPSHSVYRTHYPVNDNGVIPRSGEPMTNKLADFALDHSVDIRTDTPADMLVTDRDGTIIGAVSKSDPKPVPRRQEELWVRADHVLIACDGFSANTELVEELIPELEGHEYWGTRGNTGEAIRFARELDLGLEEPLWDFHGPFTEPDAVYLPNELAKAGAVMVNVNGERFMDCGNVSYRVMDYHTIDQPKGIAYWIFDQDIVDEFLSSDLTRHQFQYVLDEDVFTTSDSIETLATELGLDPEPVAETINAVNAAADGADIKHGRKIERKIEAPFYGVLLRPRYVKARMGIEVNTRCQVQRTDGSTIDNLYAGGNAAESLEAGDEEVYVPGMDLMTAITEGRMVAEHVATQT